VSAVAAGGNPALIRQAAWTDCGKPMVAVGHGDGPPEHALEHKAAGQAHAGGEPDDAGADATGSKQVAPTLTARALCRRVQAP
jgi:hypothetical protein